MNSRLPLSRWLFAQYAFASPNKHSLSHEEFITQVSGRDNTQAIELGSLIETEHHTYFLQLYSSNSVCFLPDEPAYLGCFRDNIPRDLQVYIPTRPATIGACVDTCKSQGFSIGALRNSDLCFCGNSYSKSNQVEEKACDMPCYDNSYEVCGGFMTFSQYWTGES